MNLQEFREMVYAEFGPQLERATPEHMRQFLDKIYSHIGSAATGGERLVIPTEGARDYNEIVATFFGRVLDYPSDMAVISLWLFACEMFYARLGDEYEETFRELLLFEIPDEA